MDIQKIEKYITTLKFGKSGRSFKSDYERKTGKKCEFMWSHSLVNNEGMVLGYNKPHLFGKGALIINQKKQKRYKKLLEMLIEYTKNILPNFIWTTVQISKNVETPIHRDSWNKGMSLAISIGEFTGGRIIQYHEDKTFDKYIETHYKPAFQDGSKYHSTEPFVLKEGGYRICFIFFNHSSFKYNTVRGDKYPPFQDICLSALNGKRHVIDLTDKPKINKEEFEKLFERVEELKTKHNLEYEQIDVYCAKYSHEMKFRKKYNRRINVFNGLTP